MNLIPEKQIKALCITKLYIFSQLSLFWHLLIRLLELRCMDLITIIIIITMSLLS